MSLSFLVQAARTGLTVELVKHNHLSLLTLAADVAVIGYVQSPLRAKALCPVGIWTLGRWALLAGLAVSADKAPPAPEYKPYKRSWQFSLLSKLAPLLTRLQAAQDK